MPRMTTTDALNKILHISHLNLSTNMVTYYLLITVAKITLEKKRILLGY